MAEVVQVFDGVVKGTEGLFALDAVGNMGLGTLLHMQTTGDGIIVLQADTGDAGGANNPAVVLSQDGDLIAGQMSINSSNQLDLIGVGAGGGINVRLSSSTTGGLANGGNNTTPPVINSASVAISVAPQLGGFKVLDGRGVCFGSTTGPEYTLYTYRKETETLAFAGCIASENHAVVLERTGGIVRCTFPAFGAAGTAPAAMTVSAVSAVFRPAVTQHAKIIVANADRLLGKATIATDGTMTIERDYPPGVFDDNESCGLAANTIVWSVS
jgi:hypothetical protein